MKDQIIDKGMVFLSVFGLSELTYKPYLIKILKIYENSLQK